MLFNSFEFLIFLPLVFILYWFVFNKSLKIQNGLLLVASYVFYGWWDWRFLSLILISSLIDFYVGLKLNNTEDLNKRKSLRNLSLVINLGFLGVFKYYNFFIDSFIDLTQVFGYTPNVLSIKVILPIGISFYTFQTLGYTLDIYKKKYEAEKSLLNFMVYVCFFPQLVAGPIERARNLLPQFKKNREFSADFASDGLRLILVGMFKKVVLADNIALAVDYIFGNYTEISPIVLLLGGSMFLVQIYMDFAGYSDIAIGTARLFGFSLMKNFDFPFYAPNSQKFWNRWHISLTFWFRDYLLLGLKSSFHNRTRFALNFLFTLTLIGFWHGANWTFIAFGFISGAYVLPAFFWRKQFKKLDIPRNKFPKMSHFIIMILHFIVYSIPAIFFRSPDIKIAFGYIGRIVSNFELSTLFKVPAIVTANFHWYALPLIIEWFMRNKEHSLDIGHLPKIIRWIIYILLLLIMINYGEYNYNQFIYFQF